MPALVKAVESADVLRRILGCAGIDTSALTLAASATKSSAEPFRQIFSDDTPRQSRFTIATTRLRSSGESCET